MRLYLKHQTTKGDHIKFAIVSFVKSFVNLVVDFYHKGHEDFHQGHKDLKEAKYYLAVSLAILLLIPW
jgi:hypothetical protein